MALSSPMALLIREVFLPVREQVAAGRMYARLKKVSPEAGRQAWAVEATSPSLERAEENGFTF